MQPEINNSHIPARSVGVARYASRVLTAAIVAILTVTFSYSPSVADGGGIWTVVSVDGKVDVRRVSSDWTPAREGEVLPMGTKVKSGDDGRITLTRNGDRIAISPRSELEVPGLEDGAAPKGVVQTLGTAVFKIMTRPDKPFTVKTPYMAAVIKGTTFTVTVNDQGAALHVTKGAVEVESLMNGQVVLVHPGQTATVSRTPGTPLNLVGGNRNSGAGGSASGAPANAGEASGAGTVSAGRGTGRVDILSVTNGLIDDGAAPRGRRNGAGRPGAPGLSGELGFLNDELSVGQGHRSIRAKRGKGGKGKGKDKGPK